MVKLFQLAVNKMMGWFSRQNLQERGSCYNGYWLIEWHCGQNKSVMCCGKKCIFLMLGPPTTTEFNAMLLHVVYLYLSHC